MTANPEEILKQPYARVLIPNENDVFSAEILEFPGCFAQGDTPNEAIDNLENAAVSWIVAAQEHEQDIPAPSTNYGYTGKIALRLPRSIHKKAIQLAQRDGISLNQFLLSAIAARVGAEDFYGRLMEKFEKQRAQVPTGVAPRVQIHAVMRVPALQTRVAALEAIPAAHWAKGGHCTVSTVPTPEAPLCFVDSTSVTPPSCPLVVYRK
jgi:predicted RNase H-like HicB family nuclease